jgi:hypothetical protein
MFLVRFFIIGPLRIIITTALVLVIIGFALYKIIPEYIPHSAIITVTKVERICSGNTSQGCNLVVSTNEGEVLNDSQADYMKLGPVDLSTKLAAGHTYRASVSGLRVDFLTIHWRRNIVSITGETAPARATQGFGTFWTVRSN